MAPHCLLWIQSMIYQKKIKATQHFQPPTHWFLTKNDIVLVTSIILSVIISVLQIVPKYGCIMFYKLPLQIVFTNHCRCGCLHANSVLLQLPNDSCLKLMRLIHPVNDPHSRVVTVNDPNQTMLCLSKPKVLYVTNSVGRVVNKPATT